MTQTLEIPDRIYRRVAQRVGRMGSSVPRLTMQLYMIWLDGGVQVEEEWKQAELPASYTNIFGAVKDKIDPSAPHDMASIRANIARRRKDFAR